jgi:uncharacterized cupin superfamily protein
VAETIVVADPATVELVPDSIPPHWVIEGAPQACSRQLAESADGTASVIAWSCTAGRFNWNYAVDEMVHLISGEVFVTNEDGVTRRLGPGDMAYFHAGARTVWYVPDKVRKVAVCRQKMPRTMGYALRVWNRAVDKLTGFSARRTPTHRHPIMDTEGGCATVQ